MKMTMKNKKGAKPEKRKNLVCHTDEDRVIDTLIHEGQPIFCVYERDSGKIRFEEEVSV